jgi:hypothetical protein
LDLATVEAAAAARGLGVLGALHPGPDDGAPAGAGTLLLLGPDGPAMWAAFSAAPEACDGAPDALDRWSARVICGLAGALGAQALFPFGGPPYAPFLRWALASGRAWPSRLGMLIHDARGVWVSYRGALAVEARLALPPPRRAASPCEGCPAPCLTACPVGAFGPQGYDVAGCRAHLGTVAGAACNDLGCGARHACPASRDAAPAPAQAAFYMRAFRAAGRAPAS